jgi:phosphopantothenoylcysteine decarboxylase / phosphopantothenate---cysteine ligase
VLKGKTVVVGVSGGIAAYKVVEVVSRLRKLNAEVHVIMTESAVEFVTPLTFQSLSHNLVITDMFAEPKKWDVEHIALARKADLFVIAPATANIIGKVANGIADDMLSTTVMATKAPVLFIPAMNSVMYENSFVQGNIKKLTESGYKFMEPGVGLMAAEGEYGKGRLPEPETIVAHIAELLNPVKDLMGKRVLITAGPTREAIDPVRYISNHSSGKMGYAIAQAAFQRGADITLVSGPVNLKKPDNIKVIDVLSADEMYGSVMQNYESNDVLIMVAAVADYRCAAIADKKIKKTGNEMTLELIKNPDIARELGKIKGNRILVGFSAETHELVTNAVSKLQAKNMDMIVANDVTAEGAGFGVDTNIVKIIRKDGEINELPLMSKLEVANQILDEIIKLINN